MAKPLKPRPADARRRGNLPKGMFRRGRAFYIRERRGGRDRAQSLGSDYADAMRRYAEFRARGVWAPKLTVAAAADRWLETRIATGRNATNQRKARTRVERYLKPFMGRWLLSKITRDDLREYRLWLEQQRRIGADGRISLTTVKWVLGDARCLFRWCEETGLLDRAPSFRGLLPRLQERPPDRLTDQEVVSVLAIPEPWAFVIRLCLGTGLRWGELCRAQAEHVQNGMLVVAHTKSGKVRRVPLDPVLLRELRFRVGRLAAFAEGSSGSFNNAVRRHSGVERFHVHQLRHTYGCRWIERDGSLAALQEILGHSTVVMTQRYARLSDVHVRAEAERLHASGWASGT